jgi:hypothetical protein
LTLVPWPWVEWWTISLSWTWFWNMINTTSLTRQVTQLWLVVTWYIKQVIGGTMKQSSCTWIVTNIDTISPVITQVNTAEWYECQDITWSITMTDDGCGSGVDTYQYKWNGWVLTSNNFYVTGLNTSWMRTIYVTWYDEVMNTVKTWVRFVWRNSVIEANNFTWSENVWNTPQTVNWKVKSQASDGECGSGTVSSSGIVQDWLHGTCEVNWNNITYTPNFQSPYEWSDMCKIMLKDDENTTKIIEIYWWWIDTEAPWCTLQISPNQQCTNSSVQLVISSTAQNVQYSFNRSNWSNNTTIW